MTRKLAPPERGPARAGFAALFALLSLGLSTQAEAMPLALESDADIAAFAEKLRDFGGAARVRWVVAGRTRAEALSAIARVESRLSSLDRPLLARVNPQSLADAGVSAEGPSVRAWISPQIGSPSSGPSCSWQVWVTDPNLPSPGADPVTVPLAPNDRLPVSAAATFRVGHSGLLQSRLYAFDETRPGAIRDLATARDINVPVTPGQGVETIYLAMARENAPFLESVKTALAASDGQRKDLGPAFALRDKWLGGGRGIGANIQAVPSDMIAPKDPAAISGGSSKASPASLVETCLYALTPTP